MSTRSAGALVRSQEGLISRQIFFDPSLYALELERVFTKCWLFLAHESQLEEPGDYVTNYMGEDPVIVCRGSDGRVRAFLNSCRHRGMRICRSDVGRARKFTCSFHGWTYSNTGELLGVPYYRDAYGSILDKGQWGLHRVPRVATYGGLIFGCWDECAPELDDYLGELRWYLDVFLERHLGGMEFIPGKQRYTLAANWKLAGENFAGDNYHLHHSHGSMFDLDIRQINPANPISFRRGLTYYNVAFDRGHGLNGILFGGERYEVDLALAQEFGPDVVEYVTECHARLRERLSQQQAQVYGLSFGNAFPNFSFNDFGALRPMGFYLWHPQGPDKLEAWQWCAVDKDAPQVIKDLARVDFTRTQAVTGIAAQDDSENFEQVTEATRGVIGRRLDFNYQLNFRRAQEIGPEGCPGRFAPYLSEANQNAFYGYWADLIDREDGEYGHGEQGIAARD